jgi:beta-xylosidase
MEICPKETIMVNQRQNRLDRRQFLVGMGAAATCGLVLTSGGLAAERSGKTGNRATISNVQPRRDVKGNIIDAHDGCLERFGDRFYLYGTAYGKTDGFGTTNRYVVYSSPDLVQWTLHGGLVNGLHHGVHYRPYVKYNPKIKKYVLWYNWYPTLWDGQYAVAVSDIPQGPFTIRDADVRVKEAKPGDLGLFVDDDGTGYLIYTSIARDHGISIERLADDYLSSTRENSGILAQGCEACAMFRREKTYYALFDDCCCFCAQGSGARVYTAKSPLGPYTQRGNINRHEKGKIIVAAQQTHIAKVPTAHGTEYIWMGDRWQSTPDKVKGHDFQFWSSPLRFDGEGNIAKLVWEDEWSIDLKT